MENLEIKLLEKDRDLRIEYLNVEKNGRRRKEDEKNDEGEEKEEEEKTKKN